MPSNVLWAQGAALVGCAMACCSYVCRGKTGLLWFQIASCVAFGTQYFLLGAPAALVNCGISAAKYIMFMILAYKKRACPWWLLVVLCIMSLSGGVLTWGGLLTLIPMTTSLLFTYGIYQKKQTVLKGIFILCALLWIAYNLSVRAYVSVAYSAVELTVSVFALAGLLRRGGEKGDFEKPQNP